MDIMLERQADRHITIRSTIRVHKHTHTHTRTPYVYINNQKGQTDGETENSEYICTVPGRIKVQCRCRGDEETEKMEKKEKHSIFN